MFDTFVVIGLLALIVIIGFTVVSTVTYIYELIRDIPNVGPRKKK